MRSLYRRSGMVDGRLTPKWKCFWVTAAPRICFEMGTTDHSQCQCFTGSADPCAILISVYHLIILYITSAIVHPSLLLVLIAVGGSVLGRANGCFSLGGGGGGGANCCARPPCQPHQSPCQQTQRVQCCLRPPCTPTAPVCTSQQYRAIGYPANYRALPAPAGRVSYPVAIPSYQQVAYPAPQPAPYAPLPYAPAPVAQPISYVPASPVAPSDQTVEYTDDVIYDGDYESIPEKLVDGDSIDDGLIDTDSEESDISDHTDLITIEYDGDEDRGEEEEEEEEGYLKASAAKVVPGRIRKVDRQDGKENCNSVELRRIVERVVAGREEDNLVAARLIETRAAGRFGGRFNAIVADHPFSYVNWYGKRNCQLRVGTKHTLTWQD